jgi:hypothetical protein
VGRADGRPLGHADGLAAGVWIAGVGARMVFYFAATHGAGPVIAAFSIAHHLTGPGAWTAALFMMALADVLTLVARSCQHRRCPVLSRRRPDRPLRTIMRC